MYEDLCKALGEDRFALIRELSSSDIDRIHRTFKNNCKKCPLALHYRDKNDVPRICCVEVHSYRFVQEVLKEGGKFIILKGV